MAFSMRLVQTLIQLGAYRVHQQRQRLVVTLHRDSRLQAVGQSVQRRFKATRNIDILQRPLVHVGVVLNRPNQVRYPGRTVLYCAEKSRQLRGSGDSHQRNTSRAGIQMIQQRGESVCRHIGTLPGEPTTPMGQRGHGSA